MNKTNSTRYLQWQNYPNPFNPETKIHFDLPKSTHVKLEIYNLLGQRIKTLCDGPKTAGNHAVKWDGKDDQGHNVSSGIYFYKIIGEDLVRVNKMVLAR